MKQIKEMTTGSKATSHNEYICSYGSCTQRYRTKFSLKRHYLGHLNIKQHACQYCGKRFSLPQYLTEHIYIHTGKKPFVCPFPGCGKSYRQAGKLSLHRKKHNLVEFSDLSSENGSMFGESECTLAEVQSVLTQLARFQLPPFFYTKTLPHPGPHVNLEAIMPQLFTARAVYMQKAAAKNPKLDPAMM